MTTPPCPQSTENPLPTYHFAILFEGAWIFTPDEGGKRILATCPLNDHMHGSQFGIWKNDGLVPVDGFDEIDVLRHTVFTVDIDPSQIVKPAASFTSLFRNAAAQYPFVYLPADSGTDEKQKRSLGLRQSAITNGRSVSIPLPGTLRAAGALLTAEVGGKETNRLFGHDLVVKRAYVTFLFIYEYSGCLKADISRTHKDEDPHRGCVTADQDGSNRTPHLIFTVYPTKEGMAAMYSGTRMGQEAMDTSNPDESTMKVHASSTFEILRQAISQLGPTALPCCDMAVYHDQNDMAFDCGDVGLTEHELGLPPKKGTVWTLGPKLPSCASGGMGAETGGTLVD